MPLVKENYRIMEGRENCAMAGLSMGGGQSFIMGLRNTDKFSWIGDFSSGLLSAKEIDPEEYITDFNANIDRFNEDFELIWLVWRMELKEFLQRLFYQI